MEWQPIETAPRDGTAIRVGWKFPEDADMQEWFVMQWSHIGRNGLIPGVVGMWVAPDGSFTWAEAGGGGPTHWMPADAPYPERSSPNREPTSLTLPASD